MISFKSSKPNAPAFLPYICAICYIAIGVFCALFFINKKVWELVVGLGLIVIMIVISQIFSWYLFATIKEDHGVLQYDVTELVDTFGNNITKYTINSITSYSKNKRYIKIYGDITCVEPLRKGKNVKSCKIYDYNDDVLNIVERFAK